MRKMKKLVFFILIVLAGTNFANNKKALKGWQPNLDVGLNISQISFTNWAKGGSNSLTWTILGNLQLDYASDYWMLRNRMKTRYGRTKVGSSEFQTNENELFLESVFSYAVGWAVDPFFSNTVRTPITKGFDYKSGTPKLISNFFDPGYVTQSIGFTFDKPQSLKTRFGIALEETFTNHFRKYSDDKTTTDKEETFKIETGMESVTTGKFELAENVELQSMLRLFTRFEHLDVWDVRFDNNITAKVNSWLNVNFSFLVLYQKSQSLKTQIKQALQVGIMYNII